MKYLVATLIILLSTPNLFAQNKCVELFSFSNSEAMRKAFDETEILKRLEALVKTSLDIQLNNFENPAQLQQAKEAFTRQLSEIIAINRRYLDVFKTMRDQKSAEIITAVNEKDRSKHEEKSKKEKAIKEALDPLKQAIKITLHEIKPGKFIMGERGRQIETEITKPFAMMNTPVTQMQWAYIKVLLGEKDQNKTNPSNYKTGTESELVVIEGIEVQLNKNHPVETVNWEDVKEYIDGLNRLSTSADSNTQKLIKNIIPGHQKGDIYDFPTEAQWEFVMRDRGNATKSYFDRENDTDLDKYAWLNRSDSTKTVATKQPRMIDTYGDGIRRPFYDLEGNVWEWCKDWSDGTLKGGADPQGPIMGTERIIRGGSFMNFDVNARSGGQYSFSPEARHSNFGFRLVRTRP